MKKLLLILLVLLVAVAAGTTFYINTIDWNKHKNIIAQQFNEATGKQIVFAGPISFKIFPTPYLNAADIKILNPTGGDKDKPLVEIRDLVARLSLMPLLQGRFAIQRMELRNPQINVEILPDGKLNWQSELDPEQRRAEDDGEAGAGVDPQQAGVGQRVTGERLHQRAGETEGNARQQTGQGARQARIQHDGAVGALTGSAEGGEYRADRQRFGADGQAKRGG